MGGVHPSAMDTGALWRQPEGCDSPRGGINASPGAYRTFVQGARSQRSGQVGWLPEGGTNGRAMFPGSLFLHVLHLTPFSRRVHTDKASTYIVILGNDGIYSLKNLSELGGQRRRTIDDQTCKTTRRRSRRHFRDDPSCSLADRRPTHVELCNSTGPDFRGPFFPFSSPSFICGTAPIACCRTQYAVISTRTTNPQRRDDGGGGGGADPFLLLNSWQLGRAILHWVSWSFPRRQKTQNPARDEINHHPRRNGSQVMIM
ncbi:hypothetical protein BDP55DRAFT_640889 [Colletotrichum godetiae]|uniref:Uncharacterized protein n=1 Tax=Colletotrichum godetiae TaxID=1209918 RepID=A0AAJ0AZL7_9PEZI|nr:uncharacterized protein BDP55DRAFT_640889 [Colletotrichum godetiae]KAK1701224.1 hypothetical protein BDP55DRAFT_640889 [Colletotrichum godetiae]